jgi:hypothetical protein
VNSFAPTAAGFRLVLRRPALALGEIAWRWSFAAAAWFLAGALLFHFFDTLPISPLERLLLRSGQPFLVWRALRSVFSGSLFRFTEAAVVTGIGLTVAWVLLASLGRLVVVRSLLDELGTVPPRSSNLSALLSLNFLRSAIFLATKLSALGTLFAASSLWASTHLRAADAGRMTFLGWFVIGTVWAALNWLLATATVLAAADSGSAVGSVGQVLRLLGQRPGPMVMALLCFSGLQMLGLAVIFGATLPPVAMAGAGHLAGLLLVEFLLLLVYSATADFLHSVAVAAYLLIWRGEQPTPALNTRPGTGPADLERSVDRNELILSDVPLVAT